MLAAKPRVLHFMLKPLFLFSGISRFNTCPLPINPQTSSASATSNDRESLCFSLLGNLIQRGLYSSAQNVIQRIISRCSSFSDVISAVEFAQLRGLQLDVSTFAILLRKFVDLGQNLSAEVLYNCEILSRGIDSDLRILNSMLICYSKLRKLDEAKSCFDRLVKLKSFPCRAACVALLRELCVQGGSLEAYDYFIRCNDAGIIFGNWFLNNFVLDLCHRGCLDKARNVFNIMRARADFIPTANLYKNLFYGLCKQGMAWEAELLGGEMESQGFFIDRKMFTALICGYCKQKEMKMTMRVFFRMLKIFCDPDNYTYNTLIHGFAKVGMIDKGWVLYSQMMQRGMVPDVVSHQILISHYCKEGQVDSALSLLKTMSSCNLSPNIHCYTAVVDALYKDKREVEVGELWDDMQKSGVVPDHVFFFKLLKRCQSGEELDLVRIILHTIVKNGCGVHPLSLLSSGASSSTLGLKEEINCLLECVRGSNLYLATVSYGICISALCASEKIDEALCCMHKMVSIGCQPLLSTFNSLIHCLLSQGHVKYANDLFNFMQVQGVTPNLDSYLIMITGHCKLHYLASAHYIFNQMEESGLKASVAIYNSIIDCLCRKRRIDKAEHMFRRMLENRVDPDEVFYATMINGYSKNGRVFEACQLFHIMVEQGIRPSLQAYTALVYGLVEKNMIEKSFIDKMFEDGVVPNKGFFTSIINQFLKRGELEFSLMLIGMMDESEIERDMVTNITLLSGLSRNISRHTGRCILDMSKRLKQMREFLFDFLNKITMVLPKNTMMVCYTTARAKKCSEKLLEQVITECSDKWLKQSFEDNNHMPSLHLCNSMIYGVCCLKSMEHAYDLLQLMQRKGVCPNHVTYTILIDGHIRHGEVDHALRLFRYIIADGCEPDKIMYKTLIRGLCRADRVGDALWLLDTMCRRGIFLSKDCYDKLLYSLCTCYSSAHAVKKFEKILLCDFLPSRNIFTRLLHTLYKVDKLHEAHKVLCEARKMRKGKAKQYLKQQIGILLNHLQRDVD